MNPSSVKFIDMHLCQVDISFYNVVYETIRDIHFFQVLAAFFFEETEELLEGEPRS